MMNLKEKKTSVSDVTDSGDTLKAVVESNSTGTEATVVSDTDSEPAVKKKACRNLKAWVSNVSAYKGAMKSTIQIDSTCAEETVVESEEADSEHQKKSKSPNVSANDAMKTIVESDSTCTEATAVYEETNPELYETKTKLLIERIRDVHGYACLTLAAILFLTAVIAIAVAVKGKNTDKSGIPGPYGTYLGGEHTGPAEAPSGPVTYRPGFLNASMNGLLLSEGLSSRVIAVAKKRVRYHDGTLSEIPFHERPDFGATFPLPGNIGGWVYTSNSEMEDEGEGGVGAITFDRDGNVIDYRLLLEKTTMNCGGGRTPWNTWVSCEEVEDVGQIYQVDPFGKREARKTTMGLDGGKFESFTYDVRDKNNPRFFASEDRERGAVRRWTPTNPNWNDPWSILHGEGTLDFLMMNPDNGTYSWTTDHKEAKINAADNYRNCEGIDVNQNLMYLVSKKLKTLFIIDLDDMMYEASSTRHGLFDGSPDQVSRVLAPGEDILYFSEEQDNYGGVHGRDSLGRYYTIFESKEFRGETTGVSFSPDGRHLYAAYQKIGILFDITRDDGYQFNGKTLNVNYHNLQTS